MNNSCVHLITAKTKIIQSEGEKDESNFLCSLKRISRNESDTINSAYQKQTQISVTGYTCHYQNSQIIKDTKCPRFEEKSMH